MILNGQLQTSVNGVNIQNGLATQINAKVGGLSWSFSKLVKDRARSKIVCLLTSVAAVMLSLASKAVDSFNY